MALTHCAALRCYLNPSFSAAFVRTSDPVNVNLCRWASLASTSWCSSCCDTWSESNGESLPYFWCSSQSKSSPSVLLGWVNTEWTGQSHLSSLYGTWLMQYQCSVYKFKGNKLAKLGDLITSLTYWLTHGLSLQKSPHPTLLSPPSPPSAHQSHLATPLPSLAPLPLWGPLTPAW